MRGFPGGGSQEGVPRDADQSFSLGWMECYDQVVGKQCKVQSIDVKGLS